MQNRNPHASRNQQYFGLKPALPHRMGTAAVIIALAVALNACTDAGGGQGNRIVQLAPRTVAADVDSRYGSYLAGRVATLRRDTDAAAVFYETALDFDPDSNGLKQRAFLLNIAEGRINRASDLAERSESEQPRLNLQKLVLAVRDVKRGRLEAAQKHLDLPVQGGTEILLAPMMRAWIYAGQDRFDQAYEALQELTKRNGFNSFYRYHYALIADLSGDADAAKQAFAELAESEAKNSARAILAEVSFISRNQSPEAALEYLREKRPLLQANTLLRRAAEQLADNKTLPPIAGSAEAGLAESFYTTAGALAQDRSSEFVKIYSRLALHLRSDLDGVKMLLAEILQGDNRREEAIAVYQSVAKSSPYWLEAQLQMANELNRLERVDEAIDLLKDVERARPDENSAVISLGDLLRGHERYLEAIDAYTRAIDAMETPEEQDWALFYSRGVAYERSKNWDPAEKDFLQALELKPDQPLVLNYLGYSWVEQRRNLKRAEEMIELAVSKRPNDGYIVDSLGWVFYQLGRYDEAVTQLERAVELRPDDPVINDHLGDAYWKIGRQLEARFQWKHALVLDPEEEDRTRIETKLELGLDAAIRELAQN